MSIVCVTVSVTNLLLRTAAMVVTVRGTKYKMKLERTEVTVFTADCVVWSLIFAATRVILE